MKRKYNPYSLPPWLRSIRSLVGQFVIPFSVFQGIRTIFLPTTFDILLLISLILLALAFRFDMV